MGEPYEHRRRPSLRKVQLSALEAVIVKVVAILTTKGVKSVTRGQAFKVTPQGIWYPAVRAAYHKFGTELIRPK